MYTIRNDMYGYPFAIEYDGVDIVHVVSSERTLKAIGTLVSTLNDSETKVGWRELLGLPKEDKP